MGPGRKEKTKRRQPIKIKKDSRPPSKAQEDMTKEEEKAHKNNIIWGGTSNKRPKQKKP